MIVFRSLIVLSRYLKCGGRQHIVPLLRRQAEFDLDALQLPYPRVAQCPQHQKRTQPVTEIEEKGWSLTPGAYVGVAPVEDDGVDFEDRMLEIHRELLSLQAESNDLMNTISNNMKEMGL